MDDCDLAKLSTKPGTLSPAFKKDILEYDVVVPSSSEKITFNPETSDNGASFSISGSGGSRDVPLKEGVVTDVKIEVTSEDGTTKKYLIHVKRLSAKDAVLKNITIKGGNLEPEFSPHQTLYYCLLPCNITEATFTPSAPDPKNVVLINGDPPKAVPLNTGLTIVNVEITSADGSNKNTYTVEVVRKQIPRYVKFTDAKSALQYECPFSLSPLYCPITVKGSKPKHTYSGPTIEELTRKSKIDPLSGESLNLDWKVFDVDADKKMAGQMAVIPLTFSGATEPMKFGELAQNLDKCNKPSQIKDIAAKFKDSSLSISRTYKEQKWEASLQQIHDETNPDTLVKAGNTHLQLYYKRFPRSGSVKKQYAEGDSPIDALQDAISCFATAIKFKPKDPNLHLELAMLLEEKYYAEDMFGLKREDKSNDGPSMNVQAKEESRIEEVLAICKLRGVDASAPIGLQIKALDQEYHHLLDSGQGGKADALQNLYAWFSKKVSQEGAAAQKAEDNDSPLGQAFQKYQDALCLSESNAVNNFQVGRMLVIQGNYEAAIKRLEAALCWNSAHNMARFYLGLAISLSKDDWKKRGREAIGYLLDGMEQLLTELSKQANTAQETLAKCSLFAENLCRASNVYYLRGIVQLAGLLSVNEVKEAMSAVDVYHTAALLASNVLPNIHRGDYYQQMEWVLLDAHTHLLDILNEKQVGNEELIACRCQRLSALIFNSTITGSAKLLELQEQTCQKLVRIQPCVSYALFLLGSAQFDLSENSPDVDVRKQKLKEAKESFMSSISLEGKNSDGETPASITEMSWWKDLMKKEEDAKKAANPTIPAGGSKATAPSSTSSSDRGGRKVSRGGITTPPRGGAARGRGRGATETPQKGSTRGGAAARGAPASRGGPARGGSTAGRGGAVKGGKPETSPAPAEEEKKDEEKVEENNKKVVGLPVITNPKSHQARLGLARVLRAADEPDEAKKYYGQVIEMAPEIHDAYIESAEMLSKSSPLEAVDVYCKFPVSENPTFDDAYIFGEIVRLLMKEKKFDDERLPPNMIAYGKVYGLGVLERYTKTLEDNRKVGVIRKVYAGVNNKAEDDPDMQAFFKFKFWI